jgi:hypothetical protein
MHPAAALALMALTPAAAAADVRTATLRDGVDPTLTYDLRRVTAKLDRSAGRLEVAVLLHRPFPTGLDGSYWYSGITVSVNGAPRAGDCRGGVDTVGATRLFIEPQAPAPTADAPEIHAASARVSYRQEAVPLPLAFAPDRLTASVTVEDELLRGADLRCLSMNAAGRSTYDPRQPSGGPASEEPLATYFAGFSPRARLSKALRRCAARYDSGPKRRACKRRARERFAAAR